MPSSISDGVGAAPRLGGGGFRCASFAGLLCCSLPLRLTCWSSLTHLWAEARSGARKRYAFLACVWISNSCVDGSVRAMREASSSEMPFS